MCQVKLIAFRLIILLLCVGLTGCDPEKGEPEPTDFPFLMQGSYHLIMETDTADIPFQLQLVTAVDSAVYGIIKSDRINYDAPIALDSMSEDSLYFHYYTNQLAIAKVEMKGRVKTRRGGQYAITIKPLSHPVDENLLKSRDLLPIQLDTDLSSFAWAAPKSGEEIYFVGEQQIYLARLREGIWETTPVQYDTANWKFYSIGLNADQSKMIAHGRPKKEELPHLGGGDYYELSLSAPKVVEEVKHLGQISQQFSFCFFLCLTHSIARRSAPE